MDNHAGNFIVNDNYIAGLVDSDFGVYIHRFYPRGRLQLRPTVSFNNTRFDLIEACHTYLDNNNINHHISTRKASVGKDKKELTIKRLSKCIEFVDLVVGYCISRRPQLEVIRKFCEDRLRYVNELGWKQNNTPYTAYQKELYNKIVELNLDYNYDTGYRNFTPSWLAGTIDGDGSICFVVTKSERVIPTVDITTGSDTMLNNVIALYESLNINYNYRTNKSKAKKRLGKNKKKFNYNIYVRNQDSLYKLLSFINNKIIAKQNQLELMIDYLEHKKINRFKNFTFSTILYMSFVLNLFIFLCSK
jgi:hypothetical protein